MDRHAPAHGRVYRLAVAPVRDVVVRDASGAGDGSWTVEGYAAVFEKETVLYDGRWYRIREEIARGAFTRAVHNPTSVLARVAAGEELVHLNYVHEMASAVAATDLALAAGDGELPIGGLRLAEEHRGLRFRARIDPEDPDAQRMAVKMRRGVVRQASFAFTIADEELVESAETAAGLLDEKWRILEIGHLYDVCTCPQGAYAQTESSLRSLSLASLGRAGLEPATPSGVPERSDESLARLSELARLQAASTTRARTLRRRT
ncbi:MAG: HK97 family phage prohead protease [Gaiellaceae bacterium]